MNPYEMLARERKARTLADYLWPRIESQAMPVSLLSDMPDEWWHLVSDVAGVRFAGQETRLLVVQYLHDRQREGLEIRK